MKHLCRRIACFLLALVSCLSISASAREQAPPTAQLVPVTPVAADKAMPALWKVSDADTTIYLFGTIHALPPGIDWFNGAIEQAFDGSQELVTEIVETDPIAMQQLIMTQATLPKGQTLRAMLTPAVKTAYERQMGELGLPTQAFDRYEPWYAAVALSTLPLIKSGYAGENGVEKVLDARAKAQGRPHGALETAAYQIGLFDSLPIDAQKRYFAEVVDQLPTVTEDLGKIVSAWRKGDADTLAGLMNAKEDDPMLIELLLLNRNKAWAGWIRQRLDKPGTVFVAVGAGHLAGPGSVQDQLAAQGLATQRLQ